MKKNEQIEIVDYDQKFKITNCDFQRMDFSNPTTVLSYGDEVKNRISNIMESTAQMSIDTKKTVIDEKLIANIVEFESSLDKIEKQEKRKKITSVSIVKNLLERLGVEQEKEEKDTYKERYLDYINKINELVKAVEVQKQASLSDIELRNHIAEEITPLICKLEEMIKVAKIDKDEFADSIEDLKSATQTQETMHTIQYKTQLLSVLNGKVNELEKSVVLYKTQIQEYRVQQLTEMQAVMSADSYIKDTAPILKAQGSVLLFNHEQTKRLNALRSLNQTTNETLLQNANAIAKNAEIAVDLSLNNGIEVETIENLNQSIKKGIEVFQNGRKLLNSQITQEQESLTNLSTVLDSYQKEVLHLIDDKEIMSNILDANFNNNQQGAKVLLKKIK